MKKLYSILSIIALMAPPTAVAQSDEATEEVVFDFMDRTSFGLCTSKSYEKVREEEDYYGNIETFDAWCWSNRPQLYNNYSISDGQYSDYLTTPELDLKAGVLYAVKVAPACHGSGYSGDIKTNLTALVGQGTDEREYAEIHKWKNIPKVSYGTTPDTQEATFTVETDGKYHLSLFGEPNGMDLYAASLVSRGTSDMPKSPADFSVVPDPDGALSVTVSFTMPSLTLSNTPLEGELTYRIYRGVQAVKTATAAPGEKVTYTEEVAMEGTAIYGLDITSGEQTTERQSITTYVGPETPTAVTDITVTPGDDGIKVSWTAPASGIHGAALVPEKLTYTVVRYINDEPTTVATGIAATEFTDTFENEGLNDLHYGITAVYGAKASEVAQSASLKIGSTTLPFSDSFAGANGDLWDNEIISGSKLWEFVEKDSQGGGTAAYDNDGGLALFRCFSNNATNQARLITPPISHKATDSPMLSFMMLHYTTYAKVNEGVKVQVSLDNGEWADVEGGHILVKLDDSTTGWLQHNVNLATALGDCKTYRVAFTTVNEYGNNITIDAVSIFNQLGKDLCVRSLTVTDAIKAGNTATLEVTLFNNGATDLAADDYTVTIDSDFPAEIALPATEPIASLESKTYTVTFPVNSLHLLDGTADGTFTFKAKATLAGDEDLTNNESATATLTASYSDGASVSGVEGSIADDGTKTITWNAAKDLSYEPVNLAESFESFDDGFRGPWNGWSTVDIDGQAGSTNYGASGSIFGIDSNSNCPKAKDGDKCISVTTKGYTNQDDWIISPEINCQSGSVMTLEFLLGFKSSTSAKYTYTVYYATEEFNVLNPADQFTHQVGTSKTISGSSWDNTVDGTLRAEIVTDIPAEAKYVAINFTGRNSYDGAVYVDNIRLTENQSNPLLGYHIYSVLLNDHINDDLISADATSFVFANDALALSVIEHPVFVTAVYADGEAAPSEALDINNMTPTGVETVVTDHGTDAPVEYYDLSGQRIAAPASTGIYIRRTGTKVEKIAVK